MTRKINVFGICGITILCILLIIASHRFTTTNYTTAEYFKAGNGGGGGGAGSVVGSSSGSGGDLRQNLRLFRPSSNNRHSSELHSGGGGGGGGGGGVIIGGGSNTLSGISVPTTYNTSVRIKDIIDAQRLRIAEEMENFEYPRDAAEQLSDLVPETGGTPIKSVIITTWRSGSTFLGDILNAMPGNYYHYEPLLNFDIIQIRGQPLANKAIYNLKQLLMCNYTDMNEYLEYGQSHTYLFTHNTRLWRQCRLYPQYCWDATFLNKYCQLFPLQSMKVVRLRAALTDQLLMDTKLNVRIVLLIRDPRGMLQSRKHRDWCPGRPDCDHPPTVCRDMISDYYAAIELLKKYPQQFKVVRYEDLSLNPYEQTQDILEFYGLPFDPQVEEFLDSHTRTDIGGVSSTFRDSKSAPFHWMRDLNFYEIDNIQESCTKAMELWGYKKADKDSIESKSFNPILPFPFSTTTTS